MYCQWCHDERRTTTYHYHGLGHFCSACCNILRRHDEEVGRAAFRRVLGKIAHRESSSYKERWIDWSVIQAILRVFAKDAGLI